MSPRSGAESHDIRALAMRASLAVAVLMLAGKLTAFFLTGSTAILSDAAESVIHIVATGIAAFSLWFARRPASAHFPYGRGKIAYFSAGFEGALIMSAALFIIWAGAEALVTGPELRRLDLGLLITAALAAVNLALGLFLIRTGRRHNALILIANGKHVLTDMWTSVAVVAGVGAVWLTGVLWLDPAVAITAGLNILVSAAALMRRAFLGLLDEAPLGHTARLVECLRAAVAEGLITGFHQLRHRVANDAVWIEVHLLLPGSTTLHDTHARATAVERRVEALFPSHTVHVTSHLEPAHGHDEHHPGGHPQGEGPLTAAS